MLLLAEARLVIFFVFLQGDLISDQSLGAPGCFFLTAWDPLGSIPRVLMPWNLIYDLTGPFEPILFHFSVCCI